MKQIISRALLLTVSVLLSLSTVFAAENGSIRGRITDKTTGEALIGVNVLVTGTYYGAATDMDGFYNISQIEAGEYMLEISYISYKIIQKTGVKITANQALTLNFAMDPSILALGQDIVVIGEKPLMDIEQTSTIRGLSSQEIKNRIVSQVEDIVTQQAGVIKQDDAIHIRGGRSYETQFMVEGLSVQDPLSGTGFGLKISSNAIEEMEVITGGYKAEYGQATSGIINVKTKSGGDSYSAYLSYKSDHLFGALRNRDFSFNTDNTEFNLGGPEPVTILLTKAGLPLPGRLYFFMNFQSQVADDYTGSTARQLRSYISPTPGGLLDETSLCPRQNNLWSGLIKLTWKPDEIHKLVYSYNRSIAINQNTQGLQTNLEYIEPRPGFPYDYSQILDNFNTYTHDNEHISLNWIQTLNAQTYYELKFSRFYAQLRSELDDHGWDNYILPVDVIRLPVEYYQPASDSTKIRVIPGDGLYDYGNATLWHDHYIEAYTFKGDITSRLNDTHSLRAGIEVSFKEMQLIDISEPYAGEYGASQDIFRVYPADGAIYLQDDLRYGGFILNAGMRLDYWSPGKYADNAIADITNFISADQRKKYKDDSYDIFGARVKMRLMPRIGVSFPVTNNQMLYFNYGHFSKQPRPQFVYSGLSSVSAKSSYQTYGNPALNPETSVKYEMGLRNKFSENDVLSISAYYKDIFDYVKTTRFTLPGRGGLSAYTYINLDYARARGVEVEYKTRIGNHIFGDISGTYSITTTKSSNAATILQIDQTQTDEDAPIKEAFAAWDRPWNISANLTYLVGNSPPQLFGITLPRDWQVNLRFFAQAGKRYTPAVFSGQYRTDGRPIYYATYDVEEKNLYSKIGSNWMTFDLSLKKNYKLWGIKYTLFMEVKNLFNRRNAQIINPVTGKAYEYGDPLPGDWNDPVYPNRQWPHDAYPYDPARYSAPRQIFFGFSAEL
jgi:outer membrane receptor protein involved in Fe transport